MRLFITIIIVSLMVGCGKKEEQSALEDTTRVSFQQSQLKDASEKLISSFMDELKSELMSAMKEGGAVNAISVCNEKAPAIASKYSMNGWNVKRVSDKNRNPDNAVSGRERDILTKFADTVNKVEFYDEWTEMDSSGTYYFYKPIFVGQFCLKCHGSTDSIDPEVKKQVTMMYPEDKAVNYMTGELRGMFVVEVKTPDGFDNIKQIMSDSL